MEIQRAGDMIQFLTSTIHVQAAKEKLCVLEVQQYKSRYTYQSYAGAAMVGNIHALCTMLMDNQDTNDFSFEMNHIHSHPQTTSYMWNLSTAKYHCWMTFLFMRAQSITPRLSIDAPLHLSAHHHSQHTLYL